jgi:biopolymer transport protein ExbD
MARKVPEINSGSTADMAFLMLTFFLLATTMNVDSGIRRQLPPMPEEEQVEQDINERNLMTVWVSADGAIRMRDQIVDISMVKDIAKEFITNPTGAANMPEIVMKDIEMLGQYPVSRGIISLTTTRQTIYNTYVEVQNELTRAFNELREDLAMRRFMKPYDKVNDDQYKAISEAIPMSISEAEPKDTRTRR